MHAPSGPRLLNPFSTVIIPLHPAILLDGRYTSSTGASSAGPVGPVRCLESAITTRLHSFIVLGATVVRMTPDGTGDYCYICRDRFWQNVLTVRPTGLV